MDAAVVTTRLRRSTPTHQAYTVRVASRRVATLVTAQRGYARRWIGSTRWHNRGRVYRGRLIVGLGVQWTATRRPLRGVAPRPATLQLCVGTRCLVYHLARADGVPAALRRFLADPTVTFVGFGSRYDRRMLDVHYGIHVASARELRAVAGMGNASMETMADRILGYRGIKKSAEVAMSAWHAPYLSPEQVEYACVDAHISFLLGVRLCSGGRAPVVPRARAPAPAPAQHAPILVEARAPPPDRYCFLIERLGAAAAPETEYDGEAGYHSVAHPSYASDDDDDSSWDKLERIGYGAATDDDDDDSYSDDGSNGNFRAGPRILDEELELEDGYIVDNDECTGIPHTGFY